MQNEDSKFGGVSVSRNKISNVDGTGIIADVSERVSLQVDDNVLDRIGGDGIVINGRTIKSFEEKLLEYLQAEESEDIKLELLDALQILKSKDMSGRAKTKTLNTLHQLAISTSSGVLSGIILEFLKSIKFFSG